MIIRLDLRKAFANVIVCIRFLLLDLYLIVIGVRRGYEVLAGTSEGGIGT